MDKWRILSTSEFSRSAHNEHSQVCSVGLFCSEPVKYETLGDFTVSTAKQVVDLGMYTVYTATQVFMYMLSIL